MTPRRQAIYLAAPLFNDMERSFNERLSLLLEIHFDVFLPQRDGNLLKNLVVQGYSLAEARALVFQQDIAALTKSDIIVAVLDGRTVDEGVAFELGYARALSKFCIGLKTDDRSLLPTGDNPMLIGGCNIVCNSAEQIVMAARTHMVNFQSA